MTQQDQSDPYAVLGISRGASLSDIRTRYLALAQRFHPDRAHGTHEGVYEEATRRMTEINVAYELVLSEARAQAQDVRAARPHASRKPPAPPRAPPQSAPPQSAPPQSAPPQSAPPQQPRSAAKVKAEADKRRAAKKINPRDLPLKDLYADRQWSGNCRTRTANRLWRDVGLEPVMIRLGNQTGLTISTPLSARGSEGAKFLSDGRHVHVVRSIAGLVSLVKGPLGRELLDANVRSVLVKRMRISSVEAVQGYRYDFPEIVKCLGNGSLGDLCSMFTAAYEWTQRLGVALGIEDIVVQMAKGSPLHRFSRVARRAKNPYSWVWRQAWRKNARYDVEIVANAMTAVSYRLSERIKWHS